MSQAALQHVSRKSGGRRTPTFTPVRGPVLQRKCACGGTPGPTGECEACRKKRLTGSNAPQLVARPLPLADKQVREVELGHTDCDWDRAVKPDEPFKPRSGDAKVKIGDEKCTLPCTAEHEAVHLQQVGPLCKSYFTCYTGAPAKAKEAKDCKEMTKPDERKKCEDLYTEYFRLECFVAVTGAWEAEAWECAAYKKSLACAEKELARGEKDCQGKLKEYKESAQKQIAKYCKPEKEKKEEGKKPEGSKEPEEPKKPAEPEKPKEPEKKPKEPKEVLFRAGTLQRSSAAGAGDEPNEVPPIVNEVLRSPGRPLDAETRAFMEPRFGHDFSNVRIHTDSKAAESARAVEALAYTVGRNIVFGAGQYGPANSEGRRLLAHELAHVVQQQSGQLSGLRASAGVVANDGFERAADLAAANVINGREVALETSAPVSIQRETPPGPETPSCGTVELFTELSMPIGVPNSYFRGSDLKEKAAWNTDLDAARKGKCEAKGSFENVKLSWDLGNPKLGSYYLMNLNKNDIKFDINPHVIYTAKPCCTCFSGTATWSFDVEVSRTVSGKVEKGKTKAPITGSKGSETCKGKKCCAVKQTLMVSLAMGDSEVTANINGKVDIDGSTFSN